MVLADIPGLIEGASEGKGLGDEFLRHISRNSVLLHVLDANSEDMARDYQIVQKELKAYQKDLYHKKQLVVINKVDEEDPELGELLKADLISKTKLKAKEVLVISAYQHRGLIELKDRLWQLVEQNKTPIEANKTEVVVFQPDLEEDSRYFEIVELESMQNEDGENQRRFQIHGKRINQIAIMTDFFNEEAVDRLWDVFQKIGLWKALEKKGASIGDRIGFARFDYWTPYREFFKL